MYLMLQVVVRVCSNLIIESSDIKLVATCMAKLGNWTLAIIYGNNQHCLHSDLILRLLLVYILLYRATSDSPVNKSCLNMEIK